MSDSMKLPLGFSSVIDLLDTRPLEGGFEPRWARTAKGLPVDPNDIPKKMSELGRLLSRSYDVTVRYAGQLNIPVIGNISGGFNRRVVVYEWSRSKDVSGTDGKTYRFGYSIRFCTTVSRWDATMNLSLAFLSAQAELGNISAAWLMEINGLSGAEVDKLVLPPDKLDVETFVLAKQSIEKIPAAVNDDSTTFLPGALVAVIDPISRQRSLYLAAVQAYAVHSVGRGRTLRDTVRRLNSTSADVNDTITEVYNYFGISDPGQKPDSLARQAASETLQGLRVDT